MKRFGEDSTELVFDELPTMMDAYKKFLGKRAGLKEPGAPLPKLTARLNDYPLSRERVDAYRKVCGIPDWGSHYVPLLYPQVLAGSLHAQLLAHPDFPLQAAGLIHVGNTITRHRHIRVYEPLTFEVELQGTRPARKGHEFDVLTRAHSDGELVWEATTTILSPHKFDETPEVERRRAFPDVKPPFERSTTIRVAADQGRRYAKVSGDYNPIHMHALTARAFGFKHAIAHGMWTLARALAEVEDDYPADGRIHLEVGFKRPVYLPSTIVLNEEAVEGGEIALEARSARGDTLHLAATIRPLGAIDARAGEEE